VFDNGDKVANEARDKPRSREGSMGRLTLNEDEEKDAIDADGQNAIGLPTNCFLQVYDEEMQLKSTLGDSMVWPPISKHEPRAVRVYVAPSEINSNSSEKIFDESNSADNVLEHAAGPSLPRIKVFQTKLKLVAEPVLEDCIVSPSRSMQPNAWVDIAFKIAVEVVVFRSMTIHSPYPGHRPQFLLFQIEIDVRKALIASRYFQRQLYAVSQLRQKERAVLTKVITAKPAKSGQIVLYKMQQQQPIPTPFHQCFL
jgi:hypothetical protein